MGENHSLLLRNAQPRIEALVLNALALGHELRELVVVVTEASPGTDQPVVQVKERDAVVRQRIAPETKCLANPPKPGHFYVLLLWRGKATPLEQALPGGAPEGKDG